jgi:hypothetical protein
VVLRKDSSALISGDQGEELFAAENEVESRAYIYSRENEAEAMQAKVLPADEGSLSTSRGCRSCSGRASAAKVQCGLSSRARPSQHSGWWRRDHGGQGAQTRRNVPAWNAWRSENPNIIYPDLRGANLIKANLCANLRRADLVGADLSEANLKGPYLSEAEHRSYGRRPHRLSRLRRIGVEFNLSGACQWCLGGDLSLII